jgi:hypothetical protein
VDLVLKEPDVGFDVLQKSPAPLGMKKVTALEKQVESELASMSVSAGANTSALTEKEKATAKTLVAKKQARALSMATAPGKQILMNGFMMWMSGKNLNIFSISTLSTAMLTPLKNIFMIHTQFRSLEDPDGAVDLQMAKLIFFALNLVWLAVGLYKMGSMRLLPTTSADWSGRIVWKEMMELTSIPPT